MEINNIANEENQEHDHELASEQDKSAAESGTHLEESTIDPQAKIAGLEKKVAELQDLYVRAQAEMHNMQRRNSEDVKKARDFSISNFAKDIIIVKDYLEMALKDQSGNFEAIKTGVDLTLKQLTQIFERQMIKEVNPKPKDKLDPHLHQAMASIEEEGAEPNTIVDVMQKGYILHERVLRPAMVKVTK